MLWTDDADDPWTAGRRRSSGGTGVAPVGNGSEKDRCNETVKRGSLIVNTQASLAKDSAVLAESKERHHEEADAHALTGAEYRCCCAKRGPARVKLARLGISFQRAHCKPSIASGRGFDGRPTCCTDTSHSAIQSGTILARAMTGFQRCCSCPIKRANSALLLPTASAVSFSSSLAASGSLRAPAAAVASLSAFA